MKNLFFVFLLVLSVSFTACSGDDDSNEPNCEALAQASADAAQAFGDDPSTENCEEYRTSLQAALDAGCFEGQNEAQIQATLDALDCSN
ncbi:hypothetical protein [Luteirhabdus pelagi]|uniref:hypothetical protein n=1 Tax=Luteirhabdus pelagi TaxID=2792783 RepID=UPI001939D59D|nr:hypothetical protein [Luteirhabdus pelagi]